MCVHLPMLPNLHARRTKGNRLVRGLLLFVVIATPTGMRAQPPPTATVSTEATPAAPADPLNRGVPRTAMLGFLDACRSGDYAHAAEFLDLRRLSAQQRAVDGPQLARHLKTVLDRTLWVDVEALSESPEGTRDDGLPARYERIGTIITSKGPVDILLDRVRRDDGVLIWKIAASTVARIPALHDELGNGILGDVLPAPLVDIRFLEVALWQWIGLVILVLVASLGSWGVVAALIRLVRPLLARLDHAVDDTVRRLLVGPTRLVIGIGIFYAGSLLLRLSVPVQAFFGGIANALIVAAATWLALRFIDIVVLRIKDRFAARGQLTAVSMIPLGRRTIKALLIAMAFVALLQNLGFNVTGLLAGLGVGGLAVALAAQETVKNFFGGVTLIADQPVRVGDFCRYGDKVGTVEDISLWSTRIRSLDRTVVSIPNSTFSGLQIENFSRRDRIWLHPTIGLRYETTPDQLRYVLIEIKRMLLAHPKVLPDPARVRFVQFNSYSLDLEIFAYIATADINEFLAIQEDVFLRIMDIVEASGTGFAFPSQTVYVGKDDGLDDERSRAAEAQVRAWREANELSLPNFPPEQARRLAHTLDYPPKGAAAPR